MKGPTFLNAILFGLLSSLVLGSYGSTTTSTYRPTSRFAQPWKFRPIFRASKGLIGATKSLSIDCEVPRDSPYTTISLRKYFHHFVAITLSNTIRGNAYWGANIPASVKDRAELNKGIKGSKFVSGITVKPVIFSDGGTYICRIRMRNGTEHYAEAVLRISESDNVPDSHPMFTASAGFVGSTKSLTIRCEVPDSSPYSQIGLGKYINDLPVMFTETHQGFQIWGHFFTPSIKRRARMVNSQGRRTMITGVTLTPVHFIDSGDYFCYRKMENGTESIKNGTLTNNLYDVELYSTTTTTTSRSVVQDITQQPTQTHGARLNTLIADIFIPVSVLLIVFAVIVMGACVCYKCTVKKRSNQRMTAATQGYPATDMQNFPRFDLYGAEQNVAPSNGFRTQELFSDNGIVNQVFQPPPEYQSVVDQSKKPAHVDSDELPPSYSKATAPTNRPTDVDESVKIL